MPRAPKLHGAYRLVLYLYPKAHREEYGGQMEQTFSDLLDENRGAWHVLATWLRVCRELPLNIIEEHIHNWEGRKMTTINRRIIIGAGAILAVAVTVGIIIALRHDTVFTGTTLARIQRPAKRPACLQTTDNPSLQVATADTTYIGNVVASSIRDVPAGTNVDVHFKTYSATNATGSAVYSGNYGTYNFVVKNVDKNASGFTGGWQMTHFAACTR